MAYNIKRGNVPGIVGEQGNQKISGAITASAFYDSQLGSKCAVEDQVAITSLSSDHEQGVLVYGGNKIAKSTKLLLFDGNVFEAPVVRANNYSGSASSLYDIPADRIDGKIPGRSINYGSGLLCHKDLVLNVNAGPGLKVTDEGLSLSVEPNSSLGIRSNRLCLDIENSLDVQQSGQSLSDADLLLVHDSSRAQARHTTLGDFYDSYIKFKTPPAAGPKNSIQFNHGQSLNGDNSLIFDASNKLLTLKGKIRSLDGQFDRGLQSNGSLEINGALYKNFRTVTAEYSDVIDSDNTILVDTSQNRVNLSIPSAKDNAGRVITIKKICNDQDKYKVVASHTLKLRCDSSNIDFASEMIIKSNYSVRTLHSDGRQWWVVAKFGS